MGFFYCIPRHITLFTIIMSFFLSFSNLSFFFQFQSHPSTLDLLRIGLFFFQFTFNEIISYS